MASHFRQLRPVIILFLVFNILFMQGKNLFAKWDVNSYVLLWANLLFFVLTVITFLLQKRGVSNKNPNVFVRSVMGSLMIKMFVVIVAMALYAFVWKQYFTKFSVLAAMFLYLVYLVVEVAVATKMNKQANA
ncbi:MAG: hypothetical protein QM791_08785 [Ferruginibacter sp.]